VKAHKGSFAPIGPGTFPVETVNDSFGHVTSTTFQDGSTSVMTYDAAGSLTSLANSLSGTLTRTYDSSNRLASETSPNGSITYTYDSVGNRKSTTVTGQQPVNYTYDTQNKLTQIAQGSVSVTFGYDSQDRVTAINYPNGITKSMSYDQISRIAGLTFSNGSTALGNLTYQRDILGRITAVGGSLARVNLPPALAGLVYDGANQQIQVNGATYSYDANGSLVSDSALSYTWDVSNRLSSVSSGPQTLGAFQYDGFGRRMTATLSGQTQQFVYDGDSLVQHIPGGGAAVNWLTLGQDQFLTRTDSAGTTSLLTDGIGSTIGLTDVGGNTTGSYAYEPFGSTTATGAGSQSSTQFTGRENDAATGLYYNRARYYNPRSQRFISQDPLGFGSGSMNSYAYAHNDPISFADPSGLAETCPTCEVGVYYNLFPILKLGYASHSFFYLDTSDTADPLYTTHYVEVFSAFYDRMWKQGRGEPSSLIAQVDFSEKGRYGGRAGAAGGRIYYSGRGEACEKRACILYQAAAFADRHYIYDPVPLAVFRQVNSNTFVHWVSLSCGMNVDRPPGSVGWDPEKFGSFGKSVGESASATLLRQEAVELTAS